MVVSFTKLLAEAHPIPRFYGVSYHDPVRQFAICHPIPLNKIIGVLRSIGFWLKKPASDYFFACVSKVASERVKNERINIALGIRNYLESYDASGTILPRDEFRDEVVERILSGGRL